MRTKAQIARKKYGMSLGDLSPGERAAVTREYNKQGASATPVRKKTVKKTAPGYSAVEFARPGVNGVKKSVVAEGTTVQDAFTQAGVKVNTSKEGILDKDGEKVMLTDVAADGALYLIVPGVDSSN